MIAELTRLEKEIETIKQNIRHQTQPVPGLLIEYRDVACRIVKLRDEV